jgi:hypothetical protein
MPEPASESFELDVERVQSFLRQTPAVIERDRARTANLVALLLVSGVLISLPVYMIALLVRPDAAASLATVFERWYAIVSPLAGAALGAYYTARAESNQGGRSRR